MVLNSWLSSASTDCLFPCKTCRPSQAEPFVPLEVLCHQLSDLCRWPSWQERNGLPEGSPLSLSRGDESLSKWRTLFAAAAGALELMVLEVPGGQGLNFENLTWYLNLNLKCLWAELFCVSNLGYLGVG
jgi:hypothetical protein